MPRIQTSIPELNEMLPLGGFPARGVSLISGEAVTGKTTLAIDIVRTYIRQPERNLVVGVVTEEPQRWQNELREDLDNNDHRLLRIYSVASPQLGHDIAGMHLVVVDSVGINTDILQYSQNNPVILASSSQNTRQLFVTQYALLLTRLVNDVGKVTVIKDRDGRHGGVVHVKFVNGRLERPEYQPPQLRSAWERLLDDEDFI